MLEKLILEVVVEVVLLMRESPTWMTSPTMFIVS